MTKRFLCFNLQFAIIASLLFCQVSSKSKMYPQVDKVTMSLNRVMEEGMQKVQNSRKEDPEREKRSAELDETDDQEAENIKSNLKTKLVTSLLDSILDNYDMYIRPGFGESPLPVQSNMVILSMGPFSDFEAEFTFQCFFRHFWTDKRLAFQNHSLFETYKTDPNEVSELILNSIMLEKVWKPDTFFRGNGLNSHIHDITRPNQLFRLRNNGYIIFSTRLTVSAKCPMDFSRYPMDSQSCLVEFGSFGYHEEEMQYTWTDQQTPITILGESKMSQFNFLGFQEISRRASFASGNYSILAVNFQFKRNIGYFVMQTYMPCMMIVVLSWVAFWINREAAPARISLGITTVLTMTTFAISSRQQIPKVSYPSAMDWFVLMCYLFVFLALVEYAAVNYFTKRGEAGKKPPPKKQPAAKTSTDAAKDNTDEKSAGSSDEPPFASMNSLVVKLLVCITGSRQYRKWKIEHITTQYNSVSQIDEICRVGFPLGFCIFNAMYWSIYMGADDALMDRMQPVLGNYV
ncbi:gamma-aminobutyric acid receptor subunit alpha-5-like [Symsagittifera roscoffensis]|uniref:gamma-aminobutyric acid receptor subunit alpha-5-like n=1 Tax=Symsagittifera roscoffensis TaxID=84072 RepID=UPI00307C84A5